MWQPWPLSEWQAELNIQRYNQTYSVLHALLPYFCKMIRASMCQCARCTHAICMCMIMLEHSSLQYTCNMCLLSTLCSDHQIYSIAIIYSIVCKTVMFNL